MGGTYVKILRKATKNMALKMPAGGWRGGGYQLYLMTFI